MRQPGESDEAWLRRAHHIAKENAAQRVRDFLGRVASGDEEALELASALMGVNPETDLDTTPPTPEEQQELDDLFKITMARIRDHEQSLLSGEPEALEELTDAFKIGGIVGSLPEDPLIGD